MSLKKIILFFTVIISTFTFSQNENVKKINLSFEDYFTEEKLIIGMSLENDSINAVIKYSFPTIYKENGEVVKTQKNEFIQFDDKQIKLWLNKIKKYDLFEVTNLKNNIGSDGTLTTLEIKTATNSIVLKLSNLDVDDEYNQRWKNLSILFAELISYFKIDGLNMLSPK